MTESMPRRRVLLGGAALAASAMAAAPSLASAATSSTQTQGATVVRWNASARRWSRRPPEAEFGVIFLSTNDPAAPPPSDSFMQPGDVWRRH
ncbi:MAG TPA: hypothetical protein VF635_08005, partial [Propionibacteriaceae bacterium]